MAVHRLHKVLVLGSPGENLKTTLRFRVFHSRCEGVDNEFCFAKPTVAKGGAPWRDGRGVTAAFFAPWRDGHLKKTRGAQRPTAEGVTACKSSAAVQAHCALPVHRPSVSGRHALRQASDSDVLRRRAFFSQV